MKTKAQKIQLLAGVCFTLALTSCDKIGRPYTQTGWATETITQNFCDPIATNDKEVPSFSRCTFPSRDVDGTILPKGETVDYQELEKGRHAYMHYCYACHGVEGDGKGPSSHGLRPPPRDFRIHGYKFAAVAKGLPNDWDFMRIVKGGLHGSAMLEWDIPDAELIRIIDFIKTFPPPPCEPGPEPVAADFKDDKELADAKKEHADKTKACAKKAERFPNGAPNLWQERFVVDAALFATEKKSKIKLAESTGAPILVPEVDPWAGNIEQALKTGKELYHLRAQCVNCHPGYVTYDEFANMQIEILKKDEAAFREDLYYSTVIVAKDNIYGVNIMPPDFTMNPVRSIRTRERDANGTWVQLDQVRELWRLIASGIGGTGMPSWKKSISDKEIWALSHYVKWLMDHRLPENKAKRIELHQALDNQPPYKPAKKAPEPEEPKPADKPDGDDDDDDKDPDGAGSAKPETSAAPQTPPAKPPAPKPPAPKPPAPKPPAPKPPAPKPPAPAPPAPPAPAPPAP